jgi:HEAT repeat protein
VPASHGDEAARKSLETRLAAVLGTGASRAAKDYVCRKLTFIGTAASVPALAALLPDKELSHMARYALERISAPQAAEALREALVKTSGAEKAGIAGSLGVRRDVESVANLTALLGDSDEQVVLAAATALGDIGTLAAATALHDAAPNAEPVKLRVADASLAAAEKLLAAGDRASAKMVYTSLVASPFKSVKLAATRGLLLASKGNT